MPKNNLYQKAITGDVNAIIQYLETYCPEKWGDKKQKMGDETKWQQNGNIGKKNPK